MTGIDVSDWQGAVDFQKVREAGNSFVIPREGYRCKPDGRFFQNVPKILAAGLELPGVYHFIYATDTDKAKEEAQSCMDNVEKAGLPKTTVIWADWEYDSVDKAKAAGIVLSASQQREIAEAFCRTVHEAGYPTGIYLNADFLINVFGRGISDRWDIWLADWSGGADYPCVYQQTSGKGSVPGVSGYCDTDKFIGNYTAGTAKEGGQVSDLCTAAEAVKAFEYWLGYCEKATSKYSYYRDKEYFEKDKGSNNYTYAGYKTGANGQPWCAAQVTQAIVDACGGDTGKAKKVMWGVYPYLACNQLWDAADDDHRFWGDYQRWTLGKGDRKTYVPCAGDVIVFTDNGSTRTHTGMVYAVDDTYVYTFEGNSGNMCRKRCYNRNSSYIYGYVKLNYADGEEPVIEPEQYGQVVCKDPELHLLSKGCAGDEVKTIQRICYSRGFKGENNKPLTVDGDFGTQTKYAVMKMQEYLGIEVDGIVGANTWAKALKALK